MAELNLDIRCIKILYTINELNKLNYFPNAHGVLKLVNGEIDSETSKFVSLSTFATLISIKGRQLASDIHQLVRYNLLSYKHNKSDDKMYLKITFKGETNLEDYLKKHTVNFKKTEKKKEETTIVLIKD